MQVRFEILSHRQNFNTHLRISVHAYRKLHTCSFNNGDNTNLLTCVVDRAGAVHCGAIVDREIAATIGTDCRQLILLSIASVDSHVFMMVN